MDEFTLSHDPKFAPHFDHRVYSCMSYVLKTPILCIEDPDRTHHSFLRQWNGMEIDINNQWSLNNGTMGLTLRLHMNNKHEMKYKVRLKVVNVQLILNTKLYAMGICDERKRLLFHFQPLQVDQLMVMYRFKMDTDKMVKKNHLSPKGWTVE